MILNHEPPKLFFLMCRQYKKTANGFRQQLSCHCFPLCNAVDTHCIPSVHEIWTCAPLIFTPHLIFEMKPPINQFCCFKIFSSVFSKGRKNVFCQPLGNKQTNKDTHKQTAQVTQDHMQKHTCYHQSSHFAFTFIILYQCRNNNTL